MQRTDIEWTDLSANPLKFRRADGTTAWACVKVSPGCANCYSEAIGKRFNRAETFNVANTSKLTPFMDSKELREIVSRRTCQGLPVDGSRCFVGDMTDLFGEWVPFELLDQLFAVMALRPQVTFQILTKRPERAAEYIGDDPIRRGYLIGRAAEGLGEFPVRQTTLGPSAEWQWPLPNAWLGTSVENQASADERIPHLLRCPAVVRFLSCEPLLGPVDLGFLEPCDHKRRSHAEIGCWMALDWVIAGGESGPNARPSHPDWFRSLRNQCIDAGVPFLFKQWGEWGPPANGFGPMVRSGKTAAGRLLDGREWNQFPEVARCAD